MEIEEESKRGYLSLSREEFDEIIRLYDPCMDDYLYAYDLKLDEYQISPHARDRFRLPSDRFSDVARAHESFVDMHDMPALAKELQEIKDGKKKYHSMFYRWLDTNGEPVWINCRGKVIDDEEGNPHFLIGCINEIGERQKADNVSGLLGETSLSAYVRKYKDKFPDGFFMRVGIDDLGAINGNLGNKYGDFIIKKTADCLAENLNEKQQLFRIVGDEFMIVDFCGGTLQDALQLYSNCRKSIDYFVEQNQYKAVFTLSAGILKCEAVYGGYDAVLKLTEFTLNEAKENGRNSYYVFSQEEYDRFKRRKKIERQLYDAVNHNFEGFEAYFQPIVDATTFQLAGAEALMRFSMPSEEKEGGIERVSPVEFIPLLEQTGLIIPAGKWMLQQSIGVCQKWQKWIPHFRMNINLSYVQVMKSNALEEILNIIRLYGIEAGNVGIELTESGYLDSRHFQKLWNGLKENGVQVILDDFGTGYSNLHCLGDLEPNYIKIDRSFTLKSLQNEYEHALMKQIIDMTHSLDLAICIEGIETGDELQDLRALGADYIQGYLFGKPCSESEFEEHFIHVGE
jgi:diguanylate cyclase (GGDEF)-like protein